MSATGHSDVPQAAVCRPHARHATVRSVQLQAAPKEAPALYQAHHARQGVWSKRPRIYQTIFSREGSIRTVESAPAFDHTMQSLLIDDEALQADSA